MSKAKWFAVRKPSTGEMIATSANHIVLPKFRQTYKNVAPDPPHPQVYQSVGEYYVCLMQWNSITQQFLGWAY